MNERSMSSESESNTKTKGGMKMKKSITIWMPVMLAIMGLAMPVLTLAKTIVLNPDARQEIIKAPATRLNKEFILSQKEPAASVYVEGWFCTKAMIQLSKMSGKDPRDAAETILNLEKSSAENDLIFWDDISTVKRQIDWEFDPKPGKSQTKSIEHCYEIDQLHTLRQKAVLWAKFILNKNK